MPTSSSGLNWTVIQERLSSYPRLAAVVSPATTRGRRHGTYSILVEWLDQGTPGCMQRLAAVESDLEVIASAGLPGYGELASRIATGGRDGVFAMLAEAFVAAWYLRSGVDVIDVHRDDGEGDVLIADGADVAHVEVYDIVGPIKASEWTEAWGELFTRLQLMELPYLVSVSMPTAWRHGFSPEGRPLERTAIPAPTLMDLDAICRRIEAACMRPEWEAGSQPPRRRLEALDEKYPELSIEIVDDPETNGKVMISSDGTAGGGGFTPSAMADRILAKKAPAVPGRRVLMVEVSRYPGETFIDQWKRERVRQKIAANVRSWDAIVAYGRWWDRPEPAQVYVLHLADGAETLLPAYGST